MKVLILIFTAFIFSSSPALARNAIGDRLVGTWHGIDASGNSFEITYSKDGRYVGSITFRLLSVAFLHEKARSSTQWSSTFAFAEQGARANDHSRHASCSLICFRVKLPTRNPNPARVAPAVVVAHL